MGVSGTTLQKNGLCDVVTDYIVISRAPPSAYKVKCGARQEPGRTSNGFVFWNLWHLRGHGS